MILHARRQHRIVEDLEGWKDTKRRPVPWRPSERRNQRFWGARGVSHPPPSRWFVLVLTLIPASAMLFPMTSLHQTGSGMISAREGRCGPGPAKKRFLIHMNK
jgi:hypothetical protein